MSGREIYSDASSIRQRIAKLLEGAENPLKAEEIAYALGIDEQEVYSHLAHIAKSIRRLSGGCKALLMVPPICKKCGYVFRDLDKPKKPSRCPRCRSEWLEPPRFIIRSTT